MNHQYIIVKHSGTEKNSRQAHLHILANRVSLSGELYKDNWIGKRATEAANSIARERNLVQSFDCTKFRSLAMLLAASVALFPIQLSL
ncbi:relaxase/mobilization nuclease domain-containing protein [Bacteroides faecis]|uniref:relaxase/mobilization nuclease domain-containing protein n=1 Tax=Bacteroides faecis TaxID=674529 RepID=UPI00374DF281